MADNRKYYYLKLKEDFFDTDEMKILESMKDGYLYSNILLKLYLKSLSNSGRLMYRNVIPYTPEILATLTRLHSLSLYVAAFFLAWKYIFVFSFVGPLPISCYLPFRYNLLISWNSDQVDSEQVIHPAYDCFVHHLAVNYQ